MRRRNKRMAGLALAVMMAMGSLAACGGQKEAPAPAAPAAADTKADKAEESKTEDTAGEAAGEALELSWYVAEPESHAWSQVSYDIAKEIEEKTNGSLKIKVYPGATLGTQAEALDMLRTGSLAFEVTGPSILASFCDQVQVYSLPYAFDNAKHHVPSGEYRKQGSAWLPYPRH